jgi:hypothetical protein
MTASVRRTLPGLLRAGACALVLWTGAGCRDSGLPGRNTPVAEAMRQAGSYPVYEAAEPGLDPSAGAFVMGGARWQTTGPPETVPQRLLRPVASTSGIQLYALSWDEPPYSRLYAAGPEGLLRLLARVR